MDEPGDALQYVARQRIIYSVAVALLVAGMCLGVVLVLRDISREQRLARLRSDFVSNVTHELKTPLTSIRMFAETMRLGRLKKKQDQQEYLKVIVNESERLTRLINTVLDFSKIEQGEKQYQMDETDLSDVVQRAVDAVEYWARAHQFTINTDIEPGINIKADADALEQAVLNLISNGMKYSGEVKEIDVRLRQNKERIYIDVRDKGFGIAESKQSLVFEKYYRAHGDHEKDPGGSGLGLTVVKHIVENHGGQIDLKSKVNQGSTFTIILPKS
jgi:signal transduction histidine kinase